MDEERKFIACVWEKIDDQEKAEAICKGFERREESNMLVIAKEFLSQFGMRGLYAGMADVVAVSMVIAICVFAGIYIYLGLDAEYAYSMVFIFSPTFYASILCLSYVKERQIHTFSVQMSCKYTFFHVLVFRMLLNSGLSMVFNVIYIFTLNYKFALNPWKALVLSFFALMIVSVFLLQTLKTKNKALGLVCVNLLWFGTNFTAFYGMRATYMGLLDQIPIGVLVISIPVCLVIYYSELKRMLKIDYKRRYSYA